MDVLANAGSERARERAELEMLVEAQRRLLEVSRSVLACLDPYEVLELVAAALARLVPHDSLVIVEADWPSRTYRMSLARTSFVEPNAAELALQATIPINDGIVGWVIREGEPLNLVDAHDDPRGIQMPGTAEVHEQLVAVPLVRRGIVAGAMKVSRMADRDRAFSSAEFDLIQLFASLASIATQNAQAHRAIVFAADTDALTGLSNHGAFQRDLHALAGQPSREPFGLLLLDLDRFKSYNDTYGHPAGDALLRRVAAAIRSTLRQRDRPYRYGGDEFALLLPETGATESRRVAERVAAAIAQVTAGAGVHVTASVGTAAWPTEATSPDELVEIADRAQYAMKRASAGRAAPAAAG